MKNGTEVKYYSGGKKFKKSETSYENGKKHGKDTYWSGPGVKMLEYTYKNGVLDGPCIDYDKHGNVIDKYSYTNGDRDSSYTDYYETEIHFPETDYYETKAGKRKSQMRLLKDGSYSYSEWHKNGKKKRKGKYDKNHLKVGGWSEWYGNGDKYSEGEFDKGNAQVEVYRPFSKGIVKCIGNYVNNHKEGQWNVYDHIKGVHERFQDSDNVVKRYDNGIVSYLQNKRTYSGGNKTGFWTSYSYPGVQVFGGSYKDGKKDGLWTYYEDALCEDLEVGMFEEKIESRGSYVNGEKHGVWYYSYALFEEYGERGGPVSTLYNNGKFVKEVPLVSD